MKITDDDIFHHHSPIHSPINIHSESIFQTHWVTKFVFITTFQAHCVTKANH